MAIKALVTGATGFIGANLVRELLNQHYRVRALVRRESNPGNINGLDIEKVFGNLQDKKSLEQALDGCDVLFHVAASYTFWTPDPKAMYATNVAGTENIFDAALKKGIKKVVYTSTESTIGVPGNDRLGTEEMETRLEHLAGHYKKSKYLAERIALKKPREGLPVVVVNPTVPVGPFDIKPTPTGQFIVDFLNHSLPAYVDTALNVVDVEDVAKGHILALKKGRIGERYILGNENITFRGILEILHRLTGYKVPRLKLPIWLALGAAYTDELMTGRIFRKRPRALVAGVKAARRYRCFDCSKASAELGCPRTPIEQALEKAVRWFRQNGYAD